MMKWTKARYFGKISSLIIFATIAASCSTKQLNPISKLVLSDQPVVTYTLAAAVTIESLKAKDTTLREGTRWNSVGELVEGMVFSTKDQVVTVNSFNVYEGYIVVKDSNVVGYYLPVDKTFVKSKPVKINFK